jgi:hypothetical protein
MCHDEARLWQSPTYKTDSYSTSDVQPYLRAIAAVQLLHRHLHATPPRQIHPPKLPATQLMHLRQKSNTHLLQLEHLKAHLFRWPEFATLQRYA